MTTNYKAEQGEKIFGTGVFGSQMVLSGSSRQVFSLSFRLATRIDFSTYFSVPQS
jgi:hypothetical protein